jgi:hypothetical protein
MKQVQVASLYSRLSLGVTILPGIEHQRSAMFDEVHCPLSTLDFGGERWRSGGMKRVLVYLLSFAGVCAERLACGPETVYARLRIGFPATQFVDQFAQFGQRYVDASGDVQSGAAIRSVASQLAAHDQHTPQQKEDEQG